MNRHRQGKMTTMFIYRCCCTIKVGEAGRCDSINSSNIIFSFQFLLHINPVTHNLIILLERETETLNRARQLVFNNEGLSTAAMGYAYILL